MDALQDQSIALDIRASQNAGKVGIPQVQVMELDEVIVPHRQSTV